MTTKTADRIARTIWVKAQRTPIGEIDISAGVAVIADELDAKDAKIAEAEAKRAEAIQTGLALTVERDALRAKIAELEQRAADVDSVSKAEFQRLDAKVAELQAISDVWHARLTWARTQAWASVLGSQFMRDDAEERKAEYEALLAKLPKESRP